MLTAEQSIKHSSDRKVSNSKSNKGWIYALQPKGKFYNIRSRIALFFYALFFALPFIKVNDSPFVLLNVFEGRFILFGKHFWPQDFFVFAVAMITGIIAIALFTTVYGRLFCGWICPQTIFMEMLFRKIEWAIEGTKAQQEKLAKAGWTNEKITKRILKHIAFFLASFIIANTFLAYVIGIDNLKMLITEPVSKHIWTFVYLIFFTLLFFSIYSFVREKVCTAICPYGRLQTVLFDKNTMQIAYDYERGEPRGKIKHAEVNVSKGDCIDCKLCVQVCPTGIDIRNGAQMECVGCTACIDACNNVMERIHKPLGLIRYASENEIKTRQPFAFTTKIKAYSILLVLLTGFLIYLISGIKAVDTYISRTKGQLYQDVDSTHLSNLYNAKIINKTRKEATVTLKLENIEGDIKMIGAHQDLKLKKEAVNELTFFIIVNKNQIHKRNTKIKIGVYKGNERIQLINSTFLGPFI